MRMLRLSVTTALLVAFVLTVPSSADWGDNDIETVLDQLDFQKEGSLAWRVRAMKQNLEENWDDFQPEFQEMVGEFREGWDAYATSENLRRLVSLARTQTEMLARNELENLEAFIGSPAETDLRDRLKSLLTQLEVRINDLDHLIAQVAPPCADVPDVPISVGLSPLRQMVDTVPGAALYPIYRAEQMGGGLMEQLSGRLACGLEYTETIAQLLQDDVILEGLDEALLHEMLTNARRALDALWVESQLAKRVGGRLDSMSEALEVEGNVAVWGWVGGGLAANLAGVLGEALKMHGEFVYSLQRKLAPVVRRLEDAAQHNLIVANQNRILANQKRLLRALWSR
jgi:hypothetical protein